MRGKEKSTLTSKGHRDSTGICDAMPNMWNISLGSNLVTNLNVQKIYMFYKTWLPKGIAKEGEIK